MNRLSLMHAVVVLIAFSLLDSQYALAFKLKGKLIAGNVTDLTEFTIVAEGSDNEVASSKLSAKGTFTLRGVSAGDRFSLLQNNNYLGPIVVAIKNGKKLQPYSIAKRGNLCADGQAQAIMALRRVPKGSSANVSTLVLALDSELDLAYVKQRVTSKDIAADSVATVATSNCAPTGAQSVDSSDLPAMAGVKNLAEGDPNDPDEDGDTNQDDIDDDNDGLPDSFDADNDGDGTLDDTDADNNDQVSNRVWNFQQMHLNLEDAYNTRVMDVSTATIDNALVTYGGLAIQIITGTQVELNCGGDEDGGEGLPYCISGGTGRAREPFPNGLALPDEMDADGDGKAEIEAGGTGDFQVAPGATSAQIRPGDTFIEEVTGEDGKVTEYVGMINAVVQDVPGIVSIQTTLATHTFSYPTNANSIGTKTNPIPVPSSGDVAVIITTYSSHYNVGAGERVVPGRIKMTSNIPNGPCTLDGQGNCSGGGSGPGLVPGSLYSNPSSGWEVVGDGIQSTTEEDTPEGEDTTVTYTMNLAGTGGVSGWDSGEQVMVPIHSLDNNGGTAAINIWFKRQ